jgi:UDP-perosamine 4-acetyltransferase
VITADHNLKLPVILVGGGGHAKVLVSTLRLLHREILGFVDIEPAPTQLLGISHLGDDAAVFLHPPAKVRLINAIGSTGSTSLRRVLHDKFRDKGYIFETLIHPSAIIAPEVQIDDGVQVMAGAIVQPGSHLGVNAIINTGARIDHDCTVGAHAHVAPGATLSGEVRIGEGAHVGTGASIIQGIMVGAASLIGAGAVVIDNVPAGETVVGIPAKGRTFKKY